MLGKKKVLTHDVNKFPHVITTKYQRHFQMYVSYDFSCKASQEIISRREPVLKYEEFLARFSVRRGWCATEVAQTDSLARISPDKLSTMISVWFWFSNGFPQRGFLQTSVRKCSICFFSARASQQQSLEMSPKSKTFVNHIFVFTHVLLEQRQGCFLNKVSSK